MKPTGNKVSVSLPGDMNAAAEQRRQSLGYRSFSAYVQHLIDEDLQRGGNHIRTPLALAEPAPPYRVPAPPATMSAMSALSSSSGNCGGYLANKVFGSSVS